MFWVTLLRRRPRPSAKRSLFLWQDGKGTLSDPILSLSSTPSLASSRRYISSHLQIVGGRQSSVPSKSRTPHFLPSRIMILTVGLVLFIAFGFIFIIQRWLSGIWRSTLLYRTFNTPRGSAPDTEIKLSQTVNLYKFPPLRERTSTKMAMGLKRLDSSNWLTLDSAYLPEHFLRCNLLCTHRPQVIQCLPGSESACHEVLSLVTSFLSSRFPQHFTLTNLTLSSGEVPAIHNHLTQETFTVGQQNCPNPLEIAAKLSMEDFNILLKNQETGEYELKASATLFPAGWKLQERIGTSMANLHKPVPGWKEKLGGSVNRYTPSPNYHMG